MINDKRCDCIFLRFARCENRFFAFTNNVQTGNNSINFLWERLSWGNRWLREGRDLLRQLTILETRTNNTVGSNVDLFCKHH